MGAMVEGGLRAPPRLSRWLPVFLIGVCLLTLPCVAQDGTARLTGKVTDSTGVAVPGTLAELRSERVPERGYRTTADSGGVYAFSRLTTDNSPLKLPSPGFTSLTPHPIPIFAPYQ